jgi:hypothetical protein
VVTDFLDLPRMVPEMVAKTPPNMRVLADMDNPAWASGPFDCALREVEGRLIA